MNEQLVQRQRSLLYDICYIVCRKSMSILRCPKTGSYGNSEFQEICGVGDRGFVKKFK